MKFNVIHFKFTTPLHISNVRSDYDKSEKTIHSDTIYSAIFEAWSRLGKTKLIPKTENDDFGFYISSLYPYTQASNGNKIYFFNKPYTNFNDNKKDDNKPDSKVFKKIEFYDLYYFEKLINFEKIESYPNEHFYGKYLSKQQIKNKDFFTSNIQTRVNIPRQTVIDEETKEQIKPTPHYIERIYFDDNSGLYAIVNYTNDDIRENILMALKFIGDEGIGTDRNIGNGKFEITEGEITINTPQDATHILNIGLFCPESKQQLTEMLSDNSRFEILQRGGWITSPDYITYRKKSIKMFKEGCVFKKPQQNNNLLYGKIVDLKPLQTPVPIQHPIWRVGKSIFLPIKSN